MNPWSCNYNSNGSHNDYSPSLIFLRHEGISNINFIFLTDTSLLMKFISDKFISILPSLGVTHNLECAMTGQNYLPFATNSPD